MKFYSINYLEKVHLDEVMSVRESAWARREEYRIV